MADLGQWLFATDVLLWSFIAGQALPCLDRAGERLGWRLARWQLARLHQMQRLHELQVQLMLLRCGAVPVMVSAAREAGLEYTGHGNLCEVCGEPRHKCSRTLLLDAGRPAPAGSCLLHGRQV